MTLLLLIAATVAAEGAYTALCALIPALHFTQAMALATGLHLLAHWLVTRHLTWSNAAEVTMTVLGVDLITHALHLGALPRAALHLVVTVTVHLYQRRHLR